MTEATFTLSFGIGPSDRPSIVVRAETAEQVKALMPDARAAYDAFCLQFKPQVPTKPTQSQEPKLVSTETLRDNLTAHCDLHDCEMKQAVSKKTGLPYYYHYDDMKGICFGNGWKKK